MASISEGERRRVEEEIRSLESLLAEVRRNHPEDWMNIERLEKEIEGKRAYLRGWG